MSQTLIDSGADMYWHTNSDFSDLKSKEEKLGFLMAAHEVMGLNDNLTVHPVFGITVFAASTK